MSILQFGFNPMQTAITCRTEWQKTGYTIPVRTTMHRLCNECRGPEPERRFAEQYLALNAAEGINWGMIRGGAVFACRNLYRANAGCSRAFGGREDQHSGRCFRKLAVAGCCRECSAALAEKLREYTRMYGRLHDCGGINYGHNTVVPREYCGKNADTQNGTNCLFGLLRNISIQSVK